MRKLVATLLAGLPLLAACAANSNPGRPETSRWREPEAPGSRESAAEAQTAPAEDVAEPPQEAEPQPAPAAPAPAPGEPVIARIGGREIGVSRLLSAWIHLNSPEVISLLERVVAAETVELEAERLGVVVEDADVQEVYREAVIELEANIRERRPDMELDDWIRNELGLEPESYRRGLRADARRELLAQRLVRGFVLTHERANVRVIVTDTREELQEVENALIAGRPFEQLAREYSVDPSKERGGQIPPVLRTQSDLARLAFMTGVGQTGGPIQEKEAGRWLLLHVDAIEQPLEGTWLQIGPVVEASLAERPVDDQEYWQWRAELVRRYDVDLEPFFRLVERAET